MKNIAIFASGNGTNAENIFRTFASGNRLRVAVVLTNNAAAGVIGRMEALGVPVVCLPNSVWAHEPQKVLEAMRPYEIDMVVLAGFMRRVHDDIINAYPGRVLNIHPSLLPAYGGKGMYGHHVHEAVIAGGEKQSGVTVHKVTPEIDGGEIVMQGVLDIAPGETAESLEARIHEIEYELYPRAIVKAFRDLEPPQADAVSAAEAPAALPQAPVPTPDEQWAEALHLPFDKSKVTPPPIRPRQTPPPYVGLPPRTAPRTAAKAMDDTREDVTERPAKSYLVLCIVSIVLFSVIPAVVALIYSLKTRRMNAMGDYAEARRASNVCQGWLIASICIGIIVATVYLPVMIASCALNP